MCLRRTRTATAHKDVSRTGIEPPPDAYEELLSFRFRPGHHGHFRSRLRKTPKSHARLNQSTRAITGTRRRATTIPQLRATAPTKLMAALAIGPSATASSAN